MCPRGDDPLTLNVDKTHIKTTSLEGREVQNVTAQSSTKQMNGGQVTFTYTDLYNAEWTTRPVDLPPVQTVHNKNGKIYSGAFEWAPVSF
jgi:hypothetical protein